ncbi:GL20226 [Drosophila persimilis]|uniref:GL20226 n=1 Tax=Drosophila persimilis TaxID=7234 RepID=B4GXQ3_DROPE|nr:GL20226 [Drosophila persimilis]
MTLQRKNMVGLSIQLMLSHPDLMFQAPHQALTISEAEAALYETDQGLESNTPERMNVLER